MKLNYWLASAVAAILALTLALSLWPEAEEEVEAPVRGLRTVTVVERKAEVSRRFPGVLQPAELTALSFDIPGRLEALDLAVGMSVKADQVIAELDDSALLIQISAAEAAVEQARAAAENTAQDLVRQEQLLERGIVTRAAVDTLRTQAVSNEQAYLQAVASLESARNSLDDTVLYAPHDGTIGSVDATGFASIAAGSPIATLYRSDRFEIRFTASFDISSQLVVGSPVEVRLADRPDQVLPGVVTEIGTWAETVSSFPLVVTLTDTGPDVLAGMAAEVTVNLRVAPMPGLLIPVTALDADLGGEPREDNAPFTGFVFLYDADSSTVRRREVRIGGVRDNRILVLDGLSPGDRVATAGVSFLFEGMAVRLLDD